MERQAITQNYRQVLCWLRGGDTTPNPEMEDMFLDVITSMVQERIKSEEQLRQEEEARRRAEVRKNYRSPLSLRSIIDSMRENGEADFTYDELFGNKPIVSQEQESAPQKEEVRNEQCTGIDSVVIGKVLCHMGHIEKVSLNMSQIQLMMYISYGVWLASTGNRLVAEHPQMWQFGPVFPRAYNKMRKDTSDGSAEFENLRKERPEVVEFLSIQFRRFAWTKASVLSVPHTASGTPWSKTRKKNPDKWGVAIEDDEIKSWFSARMAK